MPTRFSDQVALITGAAAGLGKVIAHRIAQEKGHVILADRNQALLESTYREFKDQKLSVDQYEVDIAEETSVQRLMEYIRTRHHRLDILVNSAGIVGPNGKKIAEVALPEFEQTYQVNLRGSFLITKYAIPLMEQHQYGRILLIASIAGKEGNAGMCAYSSTKAGVIGLVKSVGKEYAETNIAVNALAPAVIRTAMVEGMAPEQVTYMTDKIPMKRCGTLAEVASLVAFIVSKENSFTTGFTYDMSGGRATY